MRKGFLLLILMIGSFSAPAQVLISLLFGDKLNSEGLEFGLEGGVNWSHLNGLEADNSLRSFNLGFYFDIRLDDPWYLYTGVLVKSRLGVSKLSPQDLEFLGADTYAETGDYNQVLNYFIVPALIKRKLKNHVYLEAGPQFGLMHKSWVEFNSDVDNKTARVREYNKDLINKLDTGVVVGVGYSLMKGKGISLGLKYYYGFVDVYKDKSGTNNQSLFVKMNLPIGASK